jgi:hypothetical protein
MKVENVIPIPPNVWTKESQVKNNLHKRWKELPRERTGEK